MTSGNPRRAVFATAGHVDHGKTALMRALTGTDTDRLPEEKRRGISIELGFAELPGARVSFIDVPGHRKLVHAMIAGVGGVDGLVLCVASDDGVMPQTREHLHVAALLGIRRVLVALTKTDLVDEETLELAEADVRSTLSTMGFEVAGLVATSTVTGKGVSELGREIVRLADALPPPAPTSLAWLAVDRVFTVKGAGTIVTGTLTRGKLSTGQALFVHGAAGVRVSSCRSLEVHGRSLDEVDAPSRVAINLARVETEGVRRGDVVSTDGRPATARRIDVALKHVPGFAEELSDGSAAVVHLGTDRSAATVRLIDRGFAQLVLESALPCFAGLGFVLRGFSADPRSGAVVGGGRVLDTNADPLPPRKNKAAREARGRVLAELDAGSWRDAIRELLRLAAPKPLACADVERRLGLEPSTVTTWLARGDVAGVVLLEGGASFVSETALDELSHRAVEIVEMHHRSAHHEPGMSLETLRAEVATRTTREASDLAVARAERSGRLVVASSGVASTPHFATAWREKTAVGRGQVMALLEGAGLHGVGESDLASRTGLSADAARAILAELSAETGARRLAELWFSESVLDDLRRRVATYFEKSDELTIATFKELSGVGRKQAIPLLEQLDREGTTRRAGDGRRAGARLRK